MSRRRNSRRVRQGEPFFRSNRLRLPLTHESVPTVITVVPGRDRSLELRSSKKIVGSRKTRRTVLPRASRFNRLLFPLQFPAPSRVLTCVRRKQRRETLFALNVAGRRGVGRGKRWHRTQDSLWRC